MTGESESPDPPPPVDPLSSSFCLLSSSFEEDPKNVRIKGGEVERGDTEPTTGLEFQEERPGRGRRDVDVNSVDKERVVVLIGLQFLPPCTLHAWIIFLSMNTPQAKLLL